MRYHPARNLTGTGAVAACVLAYLIAAGFILSAPPSPGFFSDSIDYFLLADFFHGHLRHHPSVLGAQVFNHTRFPPLFPLQLALFGVDLHATARAYAVTLSTGLVALLVCLLWLRKTTGSLLVAAGLVAAGVLTPRFFLFLLEIQSELLFLLLLSSSLYLCARYREGTGSLPVLCAVSALLPLCRMAGLPMLLALAVWLLLLPPGRERWRRLAACVLMLAPAAGWLLFRQRYPVAIDYLTDLTTVLGTAPTQLLTQAASRLVLGISAQFSLAPGPLVQALSVTLLVLAACGWWQRLRKWQPDALTLPASLAMTLVWPYPAEDARLLAVALPMLALCTWQGLKLIMPLLTRRTGLRIEAVMPGAMLLLALVAAAPAWRQFIQRGAAGIEPGFATEKRTSAYFTAPERVVPVTMKIMRLTRELLAEVPRVVPQGQCVWSSLPLFATYYANFGAHFRTTPDGLIEHPAPRPALAQCNYVLVVNLNVAPVFAGPLYPLATIRAFSRPVLVSRFDWDGQATVAAALLQLEDIPGPAAP